MKIIGLFVLIATLFITGCPPKAVQLTEPIAAPDTGLLQKQEQQVTKETGKPERSSGVTDEDLSATTARREARETALQESEQGPFADILFDFDSYTIKADYLSKLKEAGDWLVLNKQVRVTIEGHCDEKGTAEYNLALGQKRSEAVRDYLVKAGIDETRIRTISYGKEIPADTAHTEEAWAKNRRAHFKIDRKG